MAIIQSHRFSQFFRRLGSLKEAYVPDLQETIMPTMDILNPFNPDLMRNRGESLVSLLVTVAAVVAQFAQVIVLPAPGTIFVPLWIFANFPSAATLQAAITAAPGGPASRVLHTDDRAATVGQISGSTQFAGSTAAAFPIGTPIFKWASGINGAAGNVWIPNPGIVMARGQAQTGNVLGWIFACDTANSALLLNILGYERAIELQEGF